MLLPLHPELVPVGQAGVGEQEALRVEAEVGAGRRDRPVPRVDDVRPGQHARPGGQGQDDRASDGQPDVAAVLAEAGQPGAEAVQVQRAQAQMHQ